MPRYASGVIRVALFCLPILLITSNLRAAEAQTTIRISSHWPRANKNNVTFLHFKERVEAESKGSIHVEIFDAAKLYGDNEIAEAVSSGAVEMGFVNLSRYAASIPAADIFQLPFLFDTDAIAAAARSPQNEMRLLIDGAILATARSRVLWWVPQGALVFLSNTESVAEPENLGGKKVRTFGPTLEAIILGCGGEPKDVGDQAQEQAYETHLIDIGVTGITFAMERRQWRFMSIITRTNIASVEGVAVINDKFWQNLSGDKKQIISAASLAANQEATEFLAAVEATAYKDLTDRGLQVVDLSKDELIRWRICSSDVLTSFVEKSGDLGRELISAYGRLRQQPCCDQATRTDASR
jgi:C4-dicarboxylate-binding protein DctP